MKIKFYLTCTFLFAIFLTKAQPIVLNLAKEKEIDKKYIEALVLYERIIFDDTDEQNVASAILGKVECLKQTNSFNEACIFIKKNVSKLNSTSFLVSLYKEWIICSYLSNQLEEAISLITQSEILFSTNVNHQWLNFIKILCLNEQNKWGEAKDIYKEWVKEYTADTLIINVYNHLPSLKNSTKAAWLATLIPGAGHFYVGKPWEAATSIIIQLTGIYFGITNYNQEYYLSAILVGGGTFGSFHTGGVRRVEELVKQYNQKKSVSFNENIRAVMIQLMQKPLQN